jgi:hypothetical protein
VHVVCALLVFPLQCSNAHILILLSFLSGSCSEYHSCATQLVQVALPKKCYCRQYNADRDDSVNLIEMILVCTVEQVSVSFKALAVGRWTHDVIVRNLANKHDQVEHMISLRSNEPTCCCDVTADNHVPALCK